MGGWYLLRHALWALVFLNICSSLVYLHQVPSLGLLCRKMQEREAAESRDEWCNTALNKIKEASPLSLKVALKSIREGRFQPLDQCLVREYRISVNWVSKRVSDDFCEGVRARLVDKDFAPKWGTTRLEEVTTDMVDCFFIPLDELEPELNLATAIREPSM